MRSCMHIEEKKMYRKRKHFRHSFPDKDLYFTVPNRINIFKIKIGSETILYFLYLYQYSRSLECFINLSSHHSHVDISLIEL